MDRMLLAIVLAIFEDLCQIDYTVADKVVLLVVFVQTCYIERGGILGVALIHLDVDLCVCMLQQALIYGCLVNMTALFSSCSVRPSKRETYAIAYTQTPQRVIRWKQKRT